MYAPSMCVHLHQGAATWHAAREGSTITSAAAADTSFYAFANFLLGRTIPSVICKASSRWNMQATTQDFQEREAHLRNARDIGGGWVLMGDVCLGPSGGPRGGAVSYERGTPVGESRLCQQRWCFSDTHKTTPRPDRGDPEVLKAQGYRDV